MIKSLKCRVCGSETTVTGFLYRCGSKTCQSVFWDKRAVKKRIRALPDDIKATLELICREASIPKVTANEFFVYVLRMKGRSEGRERVYVGETSLHPYERYLKHIAGYKSAPKAQTKEFATALISFEVLLDSRDAAKERETELAKELIKLGKDVKGGH